MTAVLQLVGVTQQYGEGELSVSALSGVDLAVERGELVAIMGATLTAVGGSRSVRRRINGWQAVIIVAHRLVRGDDRGAAPDVGNRPHLVADAVVGGRPLALARRAGRRPSPARDGSVVARAAAASGSHAPHGDRMTRLG